MTDEEFRQLKAEVRDYIIPRDHANGVTARRERAVPWDVIVDLYWSTRKVKEAPVCPADTPR